MHKFNPYKAKKIGDKILLVTISGSFIGLDEIEYRQILTNNIDIDLLKKLIKHHLVIELDNKKDELEENKNPNHPKEQHIFNVLNTSNKSDATHPITASDGVFKTNKKSIIQEFENSKSHLKKGTSLHIIVPTLRCNQNCAYCHSSPKKEIKFDMDKETAKKVVDFIFNTPSKSVMIEFQGGEPLLNFPIIRYMTEYSKKINLKFKKNIEYSIVTNLSEINEQIFDFLLFNKVKIITSFDGPEEIHTKNRPDANYKNLVKWIRIIKEKSPWQIEALCVITKNSIGNHKEIIESYIAQGFDKIWIRPVTKSGLAKINWKKIGITASEYLTLWKASIDYILKENKKITEQSSLILLNHINGQERNFLCLQSPCGAAIGQLAYNYNGDIFSCDDARCLGDEFFTLGNVKENSFQEIFQSGNVKGLISLSVNDCLICESCIFKPFCGVCPVYSYSRNKSPIPNIPEEDRCKILKGQFTYLFSLILNKSMNNSEITKKFK